MIQLNVGQAGSQLGSSLARLIGPPGPNGFGCLFVDSEPKVVCPLIEEGNASRIPFLSAASIVYDHNGRGNNWAWGYSSVASRQGILADPRLGLPKNVRATLLERSMLSIRKHAEAMDHFDSLMLLHSTGGGTGSGFGCRLLESIRDEYGSKLSILDTLVTPFSGGDTPLQHYNTVLTLACAVEHADAVCILSNDDLLQRARSAKQGRATLSTGASASTVASARARAREASRAPVSVPELNDVAAEALAGVLMPTRHRRRLPRARDTQGEDRGARDGRPAWVDVREEEEEAFAGLEGTGRRTGSPDKGKRSSGTDEGECEHEQHESDDERYGERGGWIAASVRPRGSPGARGKAETGPQGRGGGRAANAVVKAILSAASLDEVVAVEGGGEAVDEGRGGKTVAGVDCPVDITGLVQDLVPDVHRKLLDLRSVTPSPLTPGGKRPLPSSPAASWMALADSLCEGAPRYDSGSVRVTTNAARIMARGATQTECDSVDPTLGPAPSPATGGDARMGTRGGRGPSSGAVQPHWRGLPSTAEWQRVSTVLTRALSWAQGSSLDTCRTALLTPGMGSTHSGTTSSAAHSRSLTLATNSDVSVPGLVHAVACAEALLSVRAYVHVYERFGVGGDMLAEAMEAVLDVVETYRPGATGAAQTAAAGGGRASSPPGGGLLSQYADVIGENDSDEEGGEASERDEHGGYNADEYRSNSHDEAKWAET